MTDFTIHPRLLADCHRLGRYRVCHVLLHRNAAAAWFILVPEVEAADLLDLDPSIRGEVLDECSHVARYLQQHLLYEKLNFAQLGNQVPQMHLHVIGRRPDDACWPQPVWGNLPEGQTYDAAQLEQTRMHLAAGGLLV